MTTSKQQATPQPLDALAYTVLNSAHVIEFAIDQLGANGEAGAETAAEVLDNLLSELRLIMRPFFDKPMPGLPQDDDERSWGQVYWPRYSDGSNPRTIVHLDGGVTGEEWHRPPGYEPAIAVDWSPWQEPAQPILRLVRDIVNEESARIDEERGQ